MNPTQIAAQAVPPPLYYRVAIRLLAPIYRMLVKRKSAGLATLPRELNERFGTAYGAVPCMAAANQPSRGVIWCHAVSLGELNTAYPLLLRLKQAGYALWITSTTQTGFNRAAHLFKDDINAGQVNHSFVPVDKPAVLAKFIAHIQPITALFIETELWANTLHQLKIRHIPSMMVNARLTEKSYRGYQRFSGVTMSMMANLNGIIAQDSASAERFMQLGAATNKITLADSLKWLSVSGLNTANKALADGFLASIKKAHKSPVWVMASTHDGEEALALAAHTKLLKQAPNALLILVPRHPERFNGVAALCTASGLNTARRSQGDTVQSGTEVYLADSMGELMAWYQTADVAVVGGSFVPVGGHNPIEPASLAKPIIMGQYDTNCQELVSVLSAVGALVQLTGSADNQSSAAHLPIQFAKPLADAVMDLSTDATRGQAAKALVDEKQHCIDAQLKPILAILNQVRADDYQSLNQ